MTEETKNALTPEQQKAIALKAEELHRKILMLFNADKDLTYKMVYIALQVVQGKLFASELQMGYLKHEEVPERIFQHMQGIMDAILFLAQEEIMDLPFPVVTVPMSDKTH